MITIEEAFAEALQHHQAGDLPRAETIYRQILQTQPQHALALFHLGLIAHQTGKLDAAVDLLQRALALEPLNASFQTYLGLAFHARGDFDRAVVRHREALRIQPDFADAHNNLGNALADQGNLNDAVACHRQALRLRPNYFDSHNNLGNILAALGDLDQAEAHYRQAIALNPRHASPHYNLASLLEKQGKLDEAIASYRQALLLKPDYAKAHLNLGNVLLEQQKSQQAAVHYREAIRAKPDMADAYAALGVLLHDQEGNIEDGALYLQQAVRLRSTPRFRIGLATLVPVICHSMAELESWRQRLVREVKMLREQHVVHDVTTEPRLGLFYLAFQGLNDRDIQRDVAQLYSRPASPHAPRPTPHASRRIRVGFLSSFFRRHTIGLLNAGLIKNLSRSTFEVTVFSVGHQDDEIGRFIQQSADRYLEIPRHLPIARRLIADEQLDVLYYTDIGMDPTASTLAFSRLAPVQCATWGHPVTTGIETIDYFISSQALETDQATEHYTESLIRPKTLPIYYYRPQLPAKLKTRADFGLPDDAHVYACPQSLFKIHPQFDDILGGILRGDSRGTLVLGGPLSPPWEQLLRKRFASTMPDVVNRIRFLPKLSRPEFLNFMALADVLLDPLHFGGGNTSYEGLALGAPIVTLPSQFLRGRITFALYDQMRLLDCVVHSPQEYIDLALRLGMVPDFRQAIREKILAANSVLFENIQGVRELEQFFQQAVQTTI